MATERNGYRWWWMGVWRTFVGTLLAAGILGAVVAGQNIAALATIVSEMQKRVDRLDDRVTYIEQRGNPWGP